MHKGYTDLVQSLYGEKAPVAKRRAAATVKPKRPAPPTEDHEQQRLILWWEHKYPLLADLLIHIANQRKTSRYQGALLKRMGVRSGMMDLLLAIPRGSHGALFVELKRMGSGVLSYNQMDMIGKIRKQGYMVEVCYGFDQAVQVIEKYMALPVPAQYDTQQDGGTVCAG